ncbi:hypothetical protein ACIP10_35990, partial [Streptomyces galbus]
QQDQARAEEQAEQKAKEQQFLQEQEKTRAAQEAKQQQLLDQQDQARAEEQAEQKAKEQQFLQEQEKTRAAQEAKQQQLLDQQDQARAEQQAKQEELQRDQEKREQEFQRQLDQQNSLPSTPDFRDSKTVLNPDGSLTTDFTDGGFTTIDPKDHTAVTVAPDGSIDVKDLPDGATLHNPDGSWTTLNPDGTVTTDYPDGRSVTVNPARGLAETLYPDGTSEITPLSPGSSLPDYRDGGTQYTSPFEENLYDDQPLDESSLLGQGTGRSLTPGTPSSPMSPMSPMLPTGTMLSGQTSGSNNERSRTVLANGQPVTTRGGNRLYDEVTAPGYSTPTSSGMPYMPPMGGSPGAAGQGQTETSDRARSAWEPEEEDVWGTDEGGAPASIGR